MGYSAFLLIVALIAVTDARHHTANHDRDRIKDAPATAGCKPGNPKMVEWMKAKLSSGTKLIPQSKNFDDFVLEIKEALEANRLPMRAIEFLFHDAAPFNPTCTGNWMEFGVWTGGTLNFAAALRRARCGDKCPPVFGFDTFTGLPEKWERDDVSAFEANAFDQGGKFPKVEANVELVKGLFSASLPPFLKEQAKYTGTNQTMSYLHIDCDLYAGARDALTILADKIKPGTILLFDELVNYARFREHEILAFWEYLQATGTKVLPIGIAGPLPNKNFAVDLDMKVGEYHWFFQSAAFVIASQPIEPKRSPFVSAH